jgi:hypothetical protein
VLHVIPHLEAFAKVFLLRHTHLYLAVGIQLIATWSRVPGPYSSRRSPEVR